MIPIGKTLPDGPRCIQDSPSGHQETSRESPRKQEYIIPYAFPKEQETLNPRSIPEDSHPQTTHNIAGWAEGSSNAAPVWRSSTMIIITTIIIILILILSLLILSPLFNRFAHSAGPYSLMSAVCPRALCQCGALGVPGAAWGTPGALGGAFGGLLGAS